MYTAPFCWILPIPYNQVNPFHISRNRGPKKLSNLPKLSKLVRSKARVWLNTCYVFNHQSILSLQTRCCSPPLGLEIRIIWGDLKNTDKSFPQDEQRISLFFLSSWKNFNVNLGLKAIVLANAKDGAFCCCCCFLIWVFLQVVAEQPKPQLFIWNRNTR